MGENLTSELYSLHSPSSVHPLLSPPPVLCPSILLMSLSLCEISFFPFTLLIQPKFYIQTASNGICYSKIHNAGYDVIFVVVYECGMEVMDPSHGRATRMADLRLEQI